jgi:hypothetical protein
VTNALSSNAFAVMYVINAVLAMASLAFLEVFLRRLKRSEPRVHQTLGEPLVFTNNTGLNTIRAVWFLLSRQYRSLGDERARKLGGVALGLLLSALALGAITTLYFAMFPGKPSI